MGVSCSLSDSSLLLLLLSVASWGLPVLARAAAGPAFSGDAGVAPFPGVPFTGLDAALTWTIFSDTFA